MNHISCSCPSRHVVACKSRGAIWWLLWATVLLGSNLHTNCCNTDALVESALCPVHDGAEELCSRRYIADQKAELHSVKPAASALLIHTCDSLKAFVHARDSVSEKISHAMCQLHGCLFSGLLDTCI